MKTEILIFGFVSKVRPYEKLLLIKDQYFSHLKCYYDHLRVSLKYGVTDVNYILDNFIDGTKSYFLKQGHTLLWIKERVRCIKILAVQIYANLQMYGLLDKMEEYDFYNVSSHSLFGLMRVSCPHEDSLSVTIMTE